MQITIDIPEDVVAKAAELGLTPEAYAKQILEDGPQELAADRMKKVERFLREFPMAGLPPLPASAYSRESIYSDEE